MSPNIARDEVASRWFPISLPRKTKNKTRVSRRRTHRPPTILIDIVHPRSPSPTDLSTISSPSRILGRRRSGQGISLELPGHFIAIMEGPELDLILGELEKDNVVMTRESLCT